MYPNFGQVLVTTLKWKFTNSFQCSRPLTQHVTAAKDTFICQQNDGAAYEKGVKANIVVDD